MVGGDGLRNAGVGWVFWPFYLQREYSSDSGSGEGLAWRLGGTLICFGSVIV